MPVDRKRTHFKDGKIDGQDLKAAAIGLSLLVYAPEMTCISSRYSHLCR